MSEEFPNFSVGMTQLLKGIKQPPANGVNATISISPSCICCDETMRWYSGATMKFIRCETRDCPQFGIDLKFPELKLERA